jgi:DNA-binding response OmpR family regulator
VAHVLIVEDNVDAAEALRALMDLFGHEIAVAHDPETALALVRQHVPDVALLDLELPQMDGIALGRTLRKVPGANRLRLMAVTGHGSTQHRWAALRAGFERYFVKPTDAREICDAITEPLRRVPRAR